MGRVLTSWSRFSVGTGRPPVLGPEHLANHETSLGDSWDKILNAQTQLFTTLFAFIVAKSKPYSEMFEYSDIERWRTNNKSLIGKLGPAGIPLVLT